MVKEVQKDVQKETKSLNVYLVSTTEYTIRTEEHQGKKHIVVPVVMMVEGVHNGSHGPLLHTAEELGRFPASWDGIPVTVGHPQIDGMNVSATSPEVIDTECIGRVYNTYMDGVKLKAEIWADEQRLIAVSPEAYQYILDGKNLDVSVGVFTEEQEVSGIFINDNNEDEEYIAIATNIRPNHVAILPNETGACSWNDGCGVRANSTNTNDQTEVKKNTDMKDDVKKKEKVVEAKVVDNKEPIVEPVVDTEEVTDDFILTMKNQAIADFISTIVDNKQGYLELLNKIQEKLDGLDTDSTYHYVEELYDNNFVYRMRNYRDKITQLYSQPYTIDANEAVTLVGEPQQVRRNVDYVQVNKMKRTNFTNNKTKKENTMDKPCCLEKVVALIANKQTSYKEADKDWLLELGEEKLDKMIPVVVEPVDNTVQVDMTKYVEKKTVKTFEDVVALAPKDVKEQIDLGKTLYDTHRTDLIANVVASAEEGVWTEDELKEQGTKMLEKLSAQFPKAVKDYSGQGPTLEPVVHEDTEEKLLPRGVEVKK